MTAVDPRTLLRNVATAYPDDANRAYVSDLVAAALTAERAAAWNALLGQLRARHDGCCDHCTAVLRDAARLVRMGIERGASGQAPAPQPRECACGHAADQHGPHGCQAVNTAVGAGVRCTCPWDGRTESETTPDPLAYGPTGYRCGCGKDAHSNLTPCAPDAEAGTPDDAREQLRQDIALALARADRTGALGEPEDRWHEYTTEADAVLAVRDDTLTTAQQAAENLSVEVTRLRRTLTAAEQRITAALALHTRRADHDGPYCTAGCGDWPCHTATALTPPTGQDGGAS